MHNFITVPLQEVLEKNKRFIQKKIIPTIHRTLFDFKKMVFSVIENFNSGFVPKLFSNQTKRIIPIFIQIKTHSTSPP